MSTIPLTGPKLARPPFPAGWSTLPLLPSNLTLANTLPVGQSFLWHRHALPDETEEYSRAIDNPPRVVCLRQTPEAIYYTAVHPSLEAAAEDVISGYTHSWLDDYFQLGRYPELTQLYDEWRQRDTEFFAKVELDERAVGVRVLRQDPWECLVSFITSAANNIPRITSLLHKLTNRFSPPVLSLDNPDGEGETVYRLFPRAHQLPEEGLDPILRELGFGYRAGYLDVTIASLRTRGEVDTELARWRSLPLDEVRNELLALRGVGRKVADCVMLMCMDQPSLVPIDTHIYAIANRHPNLPSKFRKKTWSVNMYDGVQGFLSDSWGPMGGWCQAVVFAADLKPRTPKKSSAASTPLLMTPRDESPTPFKAEPVSLKRELGGEGAVRPPVLKRLRSSVSASSTPEKKPQL